MRRRRFLAALGTALTAGCTARASRRRFPSRPAPPPVPDPPAPTTIPSDAATATDPASGDWPPERTTVDQRTVDRTLALAPAGYTTPDNGGVELGFAAPATDEHPAVLRATLANLNEFENTFRLRETPPFDPRPYVRPRTSANHLGLYLVPTSNHPLRRTEPGYARTTDGRWVLAREDDWLPETVTLGADEAVRGEYHLVGHPDSPRAPVGRYEVADEFALGLTAWRTGRPGPTAGSRLAGEVVPSLPGDGSVNWYHDAGPETPVYLEPTIERTSLPAALQFVLHNHSRRDLECESYAIYRREDGGWRRLDFGYAHNACRNRSPGTRTAFWLRAFPGKVVDGVPGAVAIADLSVDPGTFAFAVSYDETYAALFELRGSDCTTRPGYFSLPSSSSFSGLLGW